MKSSRSSVRCKVHTIPELNFEEQEHTLTSFAGLIMFQVFFAQINLKASLRHCFQHLKSGKIFGDATVFLQLVIHILLGYRELRDSRFYRDDPLVKRLLGLKQLPDVGTISRMLKSADGLSIDKVRAVLRELVLGRLKKLNLPRVTLDFDGSVQSTGRFAEGTAVGFNKHKKGARSYYPLFCTVAQTGQVLDFSIGRAMFTTREVHGHSFWPVFRGFGMLLPMLRSKFGWILRSSAMRSLVRWMQGESSSR